MHNILIYWFWNNVCFYLFTFCLFKLVTSFLDNKYIGIGAYHKIYVSHSGQSIH